MPTDVTDTPFTPSSAMLGHWVAELQRHLPFSRMPAAEVLAFARAATETYHAPDETVLSPKDGVVGSLILVRRGTVRGTAGEGSSGATFLIEPGELFPVGAVLAGRAVTSRYEAADDLFCWQVPAAFARALAERCPAFADFLTRRVGQLLALSQQAMRDAQHQAMLAERSLQAPLSELPRKTPVACTPDTPLGDALRQMSAARVGSILAMDDAGQVQGILTRHDVLDRVVLAEADLATPVIGHMSAPVATIDIQRSLQDAVLEMSRLGIRHLPITEGGRAVSVLSERDVFALQRTSIRHIGSAIAQADALSAFVAAAGQIRQLARHLMAQGLAADTLTRLLSQLNDRLTERLVHWVASRRGADLTRAAWLAFGSEGRGEQTIATDQDNGLVFEARDADDAAAQRADWMALGDEVNQALDACGYPLCKGGVMAREPACCRSQDEWLVQFDQWLDRGTPEDLLAASIYFDLRPVAGARQLADALTQRLQARAPQSRRFLLLLTENAQQRRPPLNWRGALDAQVGEDGSWIDLKLQGTAIFVDAARLLALAHGVPATGTRERLLQGGQAARVPEAEVRAWVAAFEHLQLLRLRWQVADEPPADVVAAATALAHANRVDVRRLHAIDRRVLKEAFRAARSLQERVAMDIGR